MSRIFFWNWRAREFNVKLATPKLFFCKDSAGSRFAGQNAVGDVPFSTVPSVKIRSIEEDDGVGRRVAWVFAWRNNGRFPPVNAHAEVAAAEFMIVVLRLSGV